MVDIPRILFIAGLACYFVTSGQLAAQTRVIKSPDGKTMRVTPSSSPAKPVSGKPPAGKPGTPSKADKGKAKGKTDAGKKKNEDSSSVEQRPNKPETPPDPKELKLRPDKTDGKMRLNFNGQPWPDLMEWLAEVSGLSLDWQELPSDYLNLVTQRRYTVEEAQDLINRHLLSRGFTMLRNGELLTVVNVKKLDPAMVPRIAPSQLENRNPHEFVRVSFRLDWLIAEQAAKEFESMKSPNGKLTALKETNRLEAMDAVVNLRDIYRVLDEEQSSGGQERLVQEFKLKHTRAADVLEQLQGLLGIESSSKPSAPLTPQQIQAQQQAAMRAAQNRGKQPAQPAKPEAEVHLVVNERENSILANAPPDKMAVIDRAIQIIDVRTDRADTLLRNMDRMQVYRPAAIDPEALVKVLQDVADLDFDTKLEVDAKNNAVIAYASLADHLTIRTVINKLDGSGRLFHVIPLRRLEADYVAGTIRFMMGEEEEKQNQQPSRYYYYSPYSSRSNQEKETDKFRVDADVEYNRLLLRANDVELKEVENLLAKLGEIPAEGGNRNTLRVLDLEPGPETDKLLERIRRMWPSLGPNELLLDPSTKSKSGEEQKENRSNDPQPENKPDTLKSTKTNLRTNPETKPVSENILPVSLDDDSPQQSEEATDKSDNQTVQIEEREQSPQQAGNEDTESSLQRLRDSLRNRNRQSGLSAGDPPPISITRSPDGRLVMTSMDTRALDRLEDLMRELAPPRKEYKVFQLKYADSYYVKINLEDFFKQEDDKNSSMDNYNSWYWGYPPSSGNSSSAPHRLSRRKPLKFIDDWDTNTILVQGGSPEQLKTVDDLIQLYDRPMTTDVKSLRQSKIINLQYAKAKIVAEAVKDIYRDLLSANDKALINGQQQKPKSDSRYSYTYVFGDEEGSGQSIPRYKGALSIGVDDTSNTIIISSQPYLLNEISELITSLDESAKPFASTIRVVELENANALKLQKSLSDVLNGKPAAGQPDGRQPKQPEQKTQPQTNQANPTFTFSN